MISEHVRTRSWVVKIAGLMAMAIALSNGKWSPTCSASDKVALSDELQRARKASISANEGLRSAAGSGVFTTHGQWIGDEEPTLFRKAKVGVQFDRGKYH